MKFTSLVLLFAVTACARQTVRIYSTTITQPVVTVVEVSPPPVEPPAAPSDDDDDCQNGHDSENSHNQFFYICHKGKTLYLCENAVHAHVKHGDTLGGCN